MMKKYFMFAFFAGVALSTTALAGPVSFVKGAGISDGDEIGIEIRSAYTPSDDYTGSESYLNTTIDAKYFSSFFDPIATNMATSTTLLFNITVNDQALSSCQNLQSSLSGAGAKTVTVNSTGCSVS